MGSLDRPLVRMLEPVAIERDGHPQVGFRDPIGAADPNVLVPLELYQFVVRQFDGRTSLDQIQERVLRATGTTIPYERIEALVAELDRALVLDGPSFGSYCKDYRVETIRPAALAGRAYPGRARPLQAELERYLTAAKRGGEMDAPDVAGRTPGVLRALISPNLDLTRSGPAAAHAYRELASRGAGGVYVILGHAHAPCRSRYVLTFKDFQTPLGLAATDQPFVTKLAALCGDAVMAEEVAHRNEPSIELQVVFLQHVLGAGADRPFAIVPILVGSFQDVLEAGRDPQSLPEVRRFLDALKAAEATCNRPVTYIASVELGHIGPAHGDSGPVDPALSQRLREHDLTLISRIERCDAAGMFRLVTRESNRWRHHGLGTIYTLLRAIQPAQGRLLSYAQAFTPDGASCVSQCGIAFDTEVREAGSRDPGTVEDE